MRDFCLEHSQGLSTDAVPELCWITDVVLRSTKQAPVMIGQSMMAMVPTERHLWISLADIGGKERILLFDASVSPFELFGTTSGWEIQGGEDTVCRFQKDLYHIDPDLHLKPLKAQFCLGLRTKAVW